MYEVQKRNGLNSVRITGSQIRKGKKLLKAMIRHARKTPHESFAKTGALIRLVQVHAGPLSRFLKLSNLRSVVVQEDDQGGWYADLILKIVPDDMPDTIGNPVSIPFSSRKEAHGWALTFIRDLDFQNQLRDNPAGLGEIPIP